MMVNMSVECMNKKCVDCPELDIDVHATEVYGFGAADSSGNIEQTTVYMNKLRCSHYYRCKVIFSHNVPDKEVVNEK